MGKLVHLDDEYINIDHIVRIYERPTEEAVCVELDTGQKLTVQDRYLPLLIGNQSPGA